MAKNPFIIQVADALHGDGMPVVVHNVGPAPSRIGPEMIAIPEGQEAVSYTHLTLPTMSLVCRSRWSPYH